MLATNISTSTRSSLARLCRLPDEAACVWVFLAASVNKATETCPKSGDPPGVRTPPFTLALLINGKLRLVPTDPRDDTEGRCKRSAASVECFPYTTSLYKGCSARPSGLCSASGW